MSDRVPEPQSSASGSTLPRAGRRRLGQLAALALACSAVAAIAASFVAAPSNAATTDPQGVILISWDGARYDLLQELMHWQPIAETPRICPGDENTPPSMPKVCGEYWSCLPAICQFQIMESHVVGGKTLTRVQHASMLTGAAPDETTINTNNGASSVPYSYTIYERLRTLMGSSMQFAHVGSYRYTVRGILGWVDGSVIPDGNIRTRGHPDKFTGTGSNDNFLPLLATFQGKPFFAFEHQKGIDMAGHGAGDQSPQYLAAMVATDHRLQEVIDEVARLGMSERTHIFITTDHGFWQNQHLAKLRPVVSKTWFASQKDNLLCYQRGNVIDVVPTILATFGLDPAASIPHLNGHSLLDPTRTTDCVAPTCGDGVVEVGEDCEPGVDLADTCTTLGYLAGSVACGADCQYNTSDCADQLESTKLSISPSSLGGLDVELELADRDRGGPAFNPSTDAVDVQVFHGDTLLWEGGTDNYDPGWRVYGASNTWLAARGSRADGLIAVDMSSPVRRMQMGINAGSIDDITNFLSVGSVHTTLHVGQERFDADMDCHVSHDETGLRCAYEMPKVDNH